MSKEIKIGTNYSSAWPDSVNLMKVKEILLQREMSGKKVCESGTKRQAGEEGN